MFTGIIQEIGQIKNAVSRGGNLFLTVKSSHLADRLDIGQSISINGACQTVVARTVGHFDVVAIKETLSRTTLGQLTSGSPVNLELPLSPSDLLHGHLVQGHVDCISRIQQVRPLDGSTIFTIEYPVEYGRYIIEKGSISIDGVSLTVVTVGTGRFDVSIIPHTMNNTTFQYRKAGDSVNLEFDMIAKYIEKMMPAGSPGVTMEFLKENGY